MTCTVFVATSIDGFIARPDGTLDWLPGGDATEAEDPVVDDSGYDALIAASDVLLMGRATYDTVLGFDVGWPYDLPVVVLTNRPLTPPDGADVRVMAGALTQVLAELGEAGLERVYVDGGDVIQQALDADVVETLTVTVVPVLLGSGIRLFGELAEDRWFTAEKPRVLTGGLVQQTWRRDRTG